eukprot:360448-Chlamydomonas_euryale.AAC.2
MQGLQGIFVCALKLVCRTQPWRGHGARTHASGAMSSWRVEVSPRHAAPGQTHTRMRMAT